MTVICWLQCPVSPCNINTYQLRNTVILSWCKIKFLKMLENWEMQIHACNIDQAWVWTMTGTILDKLLFCVMTWQQTWKHVLHQHDFALNHNTLEPCYCELGWSYAPALFWIQANFSWIYSYFFIHLLTSYFKLNCFDLPTISSWSLFP